MEFNDMEKHWNRIPEKGILPIGVKSRMWSNIYKSTVGRRRKTYRWLTAACALLLLSIGAYESFTRSNVPESELMVTQTYPDDIRLLRLPDGSRVWVNQNTKIEYPETFNGNTRSIKLEGEAYFEVARDTTKPFIITSGPITTTVLGTSFSVMSYNGKDPKVCVRSGKVKVKGSQNAVFLQKGDGAVYALDDKTVRKHKIAAAEPDWKKALIDIDGLTLEQVIDKLKEDHAFVVSYANGNLKGLKIKGILDRRQGFDEMLQTVAFALQINIKLKSKNTYFISKS